MHASALHSTVMEHAARSLHLPRPQTSVECRRRSCGMLSTRWSATEERRVSAEDHRAPRFLVYRTLLCLCHQKIIDACCTCGVPMVRVCGACLVRTGGARYKCGRKGRDFGPDRPRYIFRKLSVARSWSGRRSLGNDDAEMREKKTIYRMLCAFFVGRRSRHLWSGAVPGKWNATRNATRCHFHTNSDSLL